MTTIIVDSEFAQAVQTIMNEAHLLRLVAERYEGCVSNQETLDSTGIRSALQEHLAQSVSAMREVTDAVEGLVGLVDEFIVRIDEIDDFSY